MKTIHLLASMALCAAAAACSAALAKEPPTDDLKPGLPPGAITWADPDAGFHRAPGVPGDCSVYTEMLYLLTLGPGDRPVTTLFAYDPETQKRTESGPLKGCPVVDRPKGVLPISMTLDGDGQTWIAFTETGGKRARLWEIDTQSHDCWETPVLFEPTKNAPLGVALGGVPRSSDSDPLLLAIAGSFGSEATARLALLDLATGKLKTAGKLGAFVPVALASTNEDKLVGLAGTSLAELVVSTGKLKADPVTLGVPESKGTVIGSWGGDLYIFQPVTGASVPRTRVFKDAGEGAERETTAEPDLADWVVGAGGFSCGPPKVL